MHLNISGCAAIIVAVTGVAVLQTWLDARITDDMSDATARVYLASFAAALVVFGAVAVLFRLPCFTQHLGFRSSEGVVFFANLLLSLWALSFAAVELTDDKSMDWRRYKSCTAALILDAVVTVSHIALPTRWCVMLWSDLILVAGFTTFHVMMTGSMEISVPLVLFALVSGTSFGLRSQEINERTVFRVIAEDTYIYIYRYNMYVYIYIYIHK